MKVPTAETPPPHVMVPFGISIRNPPQTQLRYIGRRQDIMNNGKLTCTQKFSWNENPNTQSKLAQSSMELIKPHHHWGSNVEIDKAHTALSSSVTRNHEQDYKKLRKQHGISRMTMMRDRDRSCKMRCLSRTNRSWKGWHRVDKLLLPRNKDSK